MKISKKLKSSILKLLSLTLLIGAFPLYNYAQDVSKHTSHNPLKDNKITVLNRALMKQYILKLLLPKKTTPQLQSTEIPPSTVPLKVMTNKDYLSYALTLKKHMQTQSNFMISPASLKLALGMLANGASGTTQKEILQAMGNVELTAYNEVAKDLMNTFNTHSNQLQLANSIWFNEDYSPIKDIYFHPSYLKTIQDTYLGTAKTVNAKNAVPTINNWITEKTHGKITNALDSSDFLTALVNTLYFKDEWKNPFTALETPLDFTNVDGKISKASFMSQSEVTLPYYEDNHMQIVELGYQNSNTSMFIILPKDSTPLTANTLDQAISNLTPTCVNIRIPRFKTEYTQSFNTILKTLGMNKAFDSSSAEFSNTMFKNMPASINAYVSEVFQKNYIAVDEMGTEAASATVIMMKLTGLRIPENTKEFIADKPFTYIIRENGSGEILFIGDYLYGEVFNR